MQSPQPGPALGPVAGPIRVRPPLPAVGGPDGYALLARAPDAVLFRRHGQAVTAAVFLAAASRLASSLPEGAHAINLCRDRLGFALAFAATVLRGQVALLTGAEAPRLAAPGERFADSYALTDDAAVAVPLRRHVVSADALLAGPVAPATIPRVAADQVAALVSTSGSTGEPVMHAKRWGALADRSMAAGERFGLAEGAPATVVATVPPGHMYGFETSVLLPLHAAASSWCGASFYPSDIRRALEAAPGPRLLVTTPLQLRVLLQAGMAPPPDTRVVSATAPLGRDLAAEVERRWGAPVLEIFGATEVGSIATRRTVAEEGWTAYPRVRLLPDPAPEDADGSRTAEVQGVRVAAPHTVPHPLADAVELLDGARFRLLGRRTDLVKCAGRRASLSGLNAVLTSIAGVEDGVFLSPDGAGHGPNARMRALVVAPELSAEEVQAALRGRIDPAFMPRRVVRVERLPRNAVGKLPREALTALLAEYGEA